MALVLALSSFSCAQKKKIYVAPTVPPVTPPAPTVTPIPELPQVVWTVENALKQADSIPALRDDEAAQSLLDAVDLSLEKFAGMDGTAVLRFGADAVPVSRCLESLKDFRDKLATMGLSEEFFSYLRENFVFYASAAPPVTFTGYYEPLLHGSLRESPQYPYPLYAPPGDLVSVDLQQYYFYKEQPTIPQIKGRVDENNRLVPYYSREEIDFKSMLAGRGLEIVWVDSLVDIFFLHIQGSGIVQLEDGSRIFVGYADQNGLPFRSIGLFLLEKQLIDRSQLSMQGMKTFLKEHPEAIPAALNSNPSYIFFQVNKQRATGTFGTRLTPWRSIASDPRLFPLGALAWIECEKPLFDSKQRISGWEKFGRFVLNQDTGGAIRGPARADLFTGHGERSELVAGNMKQKGVLFFLLKKESAKENASPPTPLS
ncbi:MAG TPA: MltA domain-containing protein [Patescibacteria group bacterium]|nr:MltA domain-containing protein [Patescibacteria group bacterium]